MKKSRSLIPQAKGFGITKPEICVNVLNERDEVCYGYICHSMSEAEAMRWGLLHGFEIAGCRSYDVVIKK